MSYTVHNYKTKKELKADVADLAASASNLNPQYRRHIERRLTIAPTSFNPAYDPTDGPAFIEGPHYPAPHRWYAKVLVRAGIVVKVLS